MHADNTQIYHVFAELGILPLLHRTTHICWVEFVGITKRKYNTIAHHCVSAGLARRMLRGEQAKLLAGEQGEKASAHFNIVRGSGVVMAGVQLVLVLLQWFIIWLCSAPRSGTSEIFFSSIWLSTNMACNQQAPFRI